MSRGLLVLLMLVLPLGTSALEIGTGMALAGALLVVARQPQRWTERSLSAVVLPALMIGAAMQAAEPGIPALGKLWPLALVLALPLLIDEEARERAIQAGLASAAVVGIGSLLLADGWPARGPFSHHLTLGYALIPPLAIALHRRAWLAAGGIAAGIVASASSGPLLSAALVAATLWWAPSTTLIGGLVLSLVLISALVHQPALVERAVLWTSGAAVATEGVLGVGPESVRAAAAAAQDRISPGFYFPLHAHDAALQAASMAGVGVWAGWAWLLWSLWQRSGTGGRAALVGIVVGGMTQDTLGDLEVIRALCAWVLIDVQPDGGVVVRRSDDTDRTERSPT